MRKKQYQRKHKSRKDLKQSVGAIVDILLVCILYLGKYSNNFEGIRQKLMSAYYLDKKHLDDDEEDTFIIIDDDEEDADATKNVTGFNKLISDVVERELNKFLEN